MNKVIKNIKIFLLWILGIVMALIILGALIFAVATENDKRNLKESRERAVIREETERKAKAEREAMEAARTVYDPALCKKDAEGMVYYAAGSALFRIPFQPEIPIRSRKGTPYERPITVPIEDETELEGCPNNPLRAGAMPYLQSYIGQQWLEITGTEFKNGFPWTRGAGGIKKHLLEVYKNKSLDGVLHKNYTRCFERVSGFRECFRKDKKDADPLSMHARTIYIDGEAPDILPPFKFIRAGQAINTYKHNKLEVEIDYLLYESLKVTIRVEEYPKNFPRLMEFDQRIKAHIKSFYIKSY